MDYVIAAKFTVPIQRVIATSNNWVVLDAGIEICEHISKRCFGNARIVVVLTQRIKDRPKATGKRLKLFEEEGIY